MNYTSGWLALMLFAGSVVHAQQDQQTGDHAARDRQYLDRLLDAKADQQGEGERFDREEFIARAEALIKSQNYDSRSEGGVRVQTDDPALDLEPTLALFKLTTAFLQESFPFVKSESNSLRVFVFRSFHNYNQMTGGDFRFSNVRPGGHYVMGSDVLAAHSRSGGSSFSATLIHERTHAWFDASLFNQGFSTPTWLSEGLAGYVGQTKVLKTGAFEFGVVGSKSMELLDGVKDAGESRKISARIQKLRAALRLTSADPHARFFEDLMGRREGGSFYDRDIDLRYAAAWALVHFVMHAEEGIHRDDFFAYLQKEATGRGGMDVFFELLKLDPETLDSQVTAWLKRVRVR